MSDRKRILLIVLAVNFTNICDVMIIMPLEVLFKDIFEINPRQFTYLVSSYGLAAFFSSIVGFFYLDRFKRKSVLLFVYAGFTIGTAICGIVPNFILLLIVRFITGLFGGIIGALALSIISDVYPYKERGQAMGYMMIAFSAASALGVPLGFFLATEFGWNVPFLAISGLSAIIWIYVFFQFPTIERHESVNNLKPKKLIRAFLANNNILVALLLGMVVVFGHFIIIPFITPYMVGNVGFEKTDITYIYLVGGLLTVGIAPQFGKFIDKWGSIKVFNILMIISFVPVILLTTMGEAPLWLGLVVTSAFFIFGSGRMIPPQNVITGAVGPDLRGAFMSIKSALQQLSIALSAFVGGLFVSRNENTGAIEGFWQVGILSILVCLIAMWLAPKLKIVDEH